MDILLAAIISCSDGKWILDGIASTELPATDRSYLILEVIKAMPDDCQQSDYHGESTR